MNTTENNKLIAEFMGVEKENGLYLFTTPMDDYKTDTLYFNTSWDWLMPVVRKIVEISCNEDEDAFLSDEYTSILETLPLAIIEDAYKVVVEFIKWYNKNKED